MPRVSAYRLLGVARNYADEPTATVPFTDLLEKVGVPTDAIKTPDSTVELLHEAAVVEAACRALSDKTFAARVGLSAKAQGTLLAYLIRASDTFEEALTLTQKFYTMSDPDLRLGLADHEDGPKVTLNSGIIPAHQYPRHREMLLFGLFRRANQITAGTLAPISVELETDDLEHCQRLADLAGCTVEGGHSGYALRLPPNGMQFPIPTADPVLLGHLRRAGEEQLTDRLTARQSLAERTVALLREQLPGRVPNGDEVAAKLGMTRRTMTRHLSSEGTNYKALLEGVQCDLAKRLLRNRESIAQVAFMLDFGDQAAFSVAFKRWTGETPARFRRDGR